MHNYSGREHGRYLLCAAKGYAIIMEEETAIEEEIFLCLSCGDIHLLEKKTTQQQQDVVSSYLQ